VNFDSKEDAGNPGRKLVVNVLCHHLRQPLASDVKTNFALMKRAVETQSDAAALVQAVREYHESGKPVPSWIPGRP